MHFYLGVAFCICSRYVALCVLQTGWGRDFAFQILDCGVVRERLYIVPQARAKIKEIGNILLGGGRIPKRKTAFSGLFGRFLLLQYLNCPRVGCAVLSVLLFRRCVAGACPWEITCRTKQAPQICKQSYTLRCCRLCPAVHWLQAMRSAVGCPAVY